MTDAEFQTEKERLESMAEKWLKPLGLLWWRLHIVYSREPKKSEVHNGAYVAGQAHVDWMYLEATITFYVPEFLGVSDIDTERILVHECMHVLINEMREEGINHEERVCTMLASAFEWTREAGIEEGRRQVLLETQGITPPPPPQEGEP